MEENNIVDLKDVKVDQIIEELNKRGQLIILFDYNQYSLYGDWEDYPKLEYVQKVLNESYLEYFETEIDDAIEEIKNDSDFLSQK